jgi:hypothetical protein
MKSCPTCKRTFEYTLTYCLVDGAVLSAPFDPQATLIIPEARQTEPPPTISLLIKCLTHVLFVKSIGATTV